MIKERLVHHTTETECGFREMKVLSQLYRALKPWGHRCSLRGQVQKSEQLRLTHGEDKNLQGQFVPRVMNPPPSPWNHKHYRDLKKPAFTHIKGLADRIKEHWGEIKEKVEDHFEIGDRYVLEIPGAVFMLVSHDTHEFSLMKH
jgi:hypothetical protein